MNSSGNKKGLILIELLIAMAIFAIGVVTIFTLFISATQGVKIGLEKTRGLFLSTEALEAAYAISKKDPDYLTPGKYEVGVNDDNQWVLIPKNGLMGHFLLSNNAQDSSIYKNHGIMQQVTFFEDRKGQPLAAARFNGIDSFIKTEYAFSLQIEGPLTISAWVDTGVEATPTAIAGKYDISKGEGGYLLYKEGGDYYFLISGKGGTASVSAPSGNLPWEQVAGVYDPGDKTISLYINGELIIKSEATNVTSINKVPEIEFFIGNDASLSYPWHGLISDVRVYNRSLTANEIAGLYNSYSAPYEKSLIVSDLDRLAGIWSFNEGEGCTAHDNSGNNNHGLIKNCSTTTQWSENREGKPGRSFNFGNNNYIEVADSPTLQIKNEISISLWIKMPEELPEQDVMTILQKRAVGSEDFSFALTYQGAEKGYGWAASAGAPDQLNQVKLAGAAIPDRWQHIVVTFNSATLEMYIDDNKIDDLTPSIISNPGTDSRLFIGQDNLSGVAIDDLRIYNKILEPAEIQAIFLGKNNYYLE
jgi:Tfp pilus assembly protein PilV